MSTDSPSATDNLPPAWEALLPAAAAQDAAGRAAIRKQLEDLEPGVLERLQEVLAETNSPADLSAITPAPVRIPQAAESETLRAKGLAALAAGQVGVILVAGGQGTRLGYDGPKGCYPLAPLSQASLFAIHAGKILALSRAVGAPIPFYIMTSETNDAATRSFFSEHDYFGLPPEDVRFFIQGMWPAMTPDAKLVLDRPDHVFMGPDGHGGLLSALKRTGQLADMAERGITTLFFFQVDNPLVEIADPVFIGLHVSEKADMSLKVCAKRDPDEGLGVVALSHGTHRVVEYTEMPDDLRTATGTDGALQFLYGSVAIHVFSLPFLQQEAERQMPVHVAHKKVPYCDASGTTIKPGEPNAFKFEKFIFDILPNAEHALLLAFDRADEFAPVKNAKGNDSPETARAAMMEKAARMLDAAGQDVPRNPDGSLAGAIEIDPLFALHEGELRERLPPDFAVAGDVWLKPKE